MLQASKKRKVTEEGRKFQNAWTVNYFFVEFCDKPTCLICRESLSVFKEANVKRHYETRHKTVHDNLQGNARIEQAEILKKNFARNTDAVKNMFDKKTQGKENLIEASYEIASIIAAENQPFSSGEFVKKCILAAVDKIIPEKKSAFSDISLSHQTIARRIEGIGEDLQSQLKFSVQNCCYFALALDESTDVRDIAQLLIFIRAIDTNFNLIEELASLQSMRGRTTGEDIYKEVVSCVENTLQLDWARLCGIATDGAPSMTGTNIGFVTRIKNCMKSRGLEEPFIVHCIIHLQALCSKAIGMEHVMDVCSKENSKFYSFTRTEPQTISGVSEGSWR